MPDPKRGLTVQPAVTHLGVVRETHGYRRPRDSPNTTMRSAPSRCDRSAWAASERSPRCPGARARPYPSPWRQGDVPRTQLHTVLGGQLHLFRAGQGRLGRRTRHAVGQTCSPVDGISRPKFGAWQLVRRFAGHPAKTSE